MTSKEAFISLTYFKTGSSAGKGLSRFQKLKGFEGVFRNFACIPVVPCPPLRDELAEEWLVFSAVCEAQSANKPPNASSMAQLSRNSAHGACHIEFGSQ